MYWNLAPPYSKWAHGELLATVTSGQQGARLGSSSTSTAPTATSEEHPQLEWESKATRGVGWAQVAMLALNNSFLQCCALSLNVHLAHLYMPCLLEGLPLENESCMYCLFSTSWVMPLHNIMLQILNSSNERPRHLTVPSAWVEMESSLRDAL